MHVEYIQHVWMGPYWKRYVQGQSVQQVCFLSFETDSRLCAAIFRKKCFKWNDGNEL